MSDPASIFDNSNSVVTPPINDGTGTPSNVQIDPNINTLLNEIKNERGEPKYKTLQDAIVALKHSQDYIPQLTNQLSQKDIELNNANAKAAEIEELKRTVQALTQRDPDQKPTSSPVVIDEEKIAQLVSQNITKAEQKKVVTANLQSVASTLKASFGTEAEVKYNEKAAELGMSVPEFNALAARSPKVVLEMLGVKVQAKPLANGHDTNLNTSALQPHQDTSIGRNKVPTLMGATTQDVRRESLEARKMVDELHAQGKSVHDLTDPKVYFKHFGGG